GVRGRPPSSRTRPLRRPRRKPCPKPRKKGESLMRRNQHVVPHDGEWAVRGEGNSRVTSRHRTQREAIDVARRLARRAGGELLIHSRTGRVRRRDTSGGNDPYPP